MKVQVKVSPNVIIIAEGEKQTDVFKELASMQEIFGNTCGRCQGTDTQFVVRTVEENDYFEVRCRNLKCKAVLSFGQTKKGGSLFPHKTKNDEDGKKSYLPYGGWLVYNPQTKQKE